MNAEIAVASFAGAYCLLAWIGLTIADHRAGRRS